MRRINHKVHIRAIRIIYQIVWVYRKAVTDISPETYDVSYLNSYKGKSKGALGL
jgi:hypothetical protein